MSNFFVHVALKTNWCILPCRIKKKERKVTKKKKKKNIEKRKKKNNNEIKKDRKAK